MGKEDDSILINSGETPEELDQRIKARKGSVKRVLDKDGNVLKGWGYPQSIPNATETSRKITDVLESGEVLRGWGYPQSIPEPPESQS
jgi:hypothetical protein